MSRVHDDRQPRMIGRRALVLGGAAVIASPVSAGPGVPPGSALAFRLMRHGSEIGRHTVSFQRQGDALTVHVAVDAKVTLLSIPIVRYTHRAVETWDDGKLVALTGETDKNGQREWVTASRAGQELVVTGSRTARYVAPDAAIATSYWNRQMVAGPMISLEDGVLLRPKVALRTGEAIPVASGATIPADHYSLRGAFDVDVWYDRADTWAGLAFDVADGSSVRYERL